MAAGGRDRALSIHPTSDLAKFLSMGKRFLPLVPFHDDDDDDVDDVDNDDAKKSKLPANNNSIQNQPSELT